MATMTKSPRRPRNGIFAALDIGTTKVVCFVAKVEGGQIRVVGIGHQVAKGMRNGAIVGMEDVAHSIVNAVSAAEQMAGETLESIIVNASGPGLQSRTVSVEGQISGHEVSDGDLRRVLDQARHTDLAPDRYLLHAVPVGYTIDGSRGIRDPRGMFGERLGLNMHLVTAPTSTVRNLATVVGRGHLHVEEFVASPYAAGLGCLVEDEVDLGATVVDMGGGTTTLAVFFDGALVHTDTLAVGGTHVTSDIARGLSTTLAHAERMKTLYGSAVASPADEREVIDVPLVGEDAPAQANHVPKSILNGIIQPRLEETFEMIRSRLEASGFDRVAGRRLVLTGGASQLQGVRELAAMVLDKQVRMGRPLRMAGLSDQTGGAAFSTCSGLLQFAVRKGAEAPEPARTSESHGAGWFGRFGLWLKENL